MVWCGSGADSKDHPPPSPVPHLPEKDVFFFSMGLLCRFACWFFRFGGGGGGAMIADTALQQESK